MDLSSITTSPGEDRQKVLGATKTLVESRRWKICADNKGLERQFKFKTFRATWDFMNHIAAECKKQKHHPEWTNIFNKTHIRWTTHSPEGLSSKDTHMAGFCDEAGEQFGEVPNEPAEEIGSAGRMEAGDCCKPRV